MSFAFGSFTIPRERARRHGAAAALTAAPTEPISFASTLTERGDRATIAIGTPSGVQPRLAEINLLLMSVGIPTLALTATAGVIRVTVPAPQESAALSTLRENAARWERPRPRAPWRRRRGG